MLISATKQCFGFALIRYASAFHDAWKEEDKSCLWILRESLASGATTYFSSRNGATRQTNSQSECWIQKFYLLLAEKSYEAHTIGRSLCCCSNSIYEPFEWYFAENGRVNFNIMFDIENASFHFNAYTNTPNTIAANQCPIR